MVLNLVLNLVLNSISSNECITCNDKDPTWLNDHIKRFINQKNGIFRKYFKDGRPNYIYENLQNITLHLTEAICRSKKKFTMNVLPISPITLILHHKDIGE